MSGDLTGRGRVTICRLTHHWPDRYCLVAYTTTGDFGDTAIVGVVPVPELEHPRLLSVAAKHRPASVYGSAGGHDHACACWVINAGWGARVVPTAAMDVKEVGWSLRLDRSVQLEKTMYGHDRLHTGALTLDDPGLVQTALDRLTPPARPRVPVAS